MRGFKTLYKARKMPATRQRKASAEMDLLLTPYRSSPAGQNLQAASARWHSLEELMFVEQFASERALGFYFKLVVNECLRRRDGAGIKAAVATSSYHGGNDIPEPSSLTIPSLGWLLTTVRRRCRKIWSCARRCVRRCGRTRRPDDEARAERIVVVEEPAYHFSASVQPRIGFQFVPTTCAVAG